MPLNKMPVRGIRCFVGEMSLPVAKRTIVPFIGTGL